MLVSVCYPWLNHPGEGRIGRSLRPQFLGRCGIRPDSETMEYFRPVEAPERNSFGSRAHYKLQPHKLKQRSLMDISSITDMEDDCALPERGFQRSQRSKDTDRVAYQERGNGGAWVQHEAALRKALETDEDWAGSFDEAAMNREYDDQVGAPQQLPSGDNKQLLSNLAELAQGERLLGDQGQEQVVVEGVSRLSRSGSSRPATLPAW